MRSHTDRHLSFCCALSAGAALLTASSLHAQISFTDVAGDVGLGGETYTSATNKHGLGVGWIDFNADNKPDLFAANGYGENLHLYRNDGGTFTLVDELLPVLPTYETMAAIFGDYDNDGDQDIYLLTDNETLFLFNPVNPTHGPPNILLKNLWVENGNALSEPLFEDVTLAAGVSDTDPGAKGEYNAYRSATGAWVDYDRDGYLDLFVGHWVTAHPGEPYLKDRLYHNNQDGTFEDVTDLCGVHTEIDPTKMRSALAMFAGHLDQDLWPDIYVGNVRDPGYHEDFYYRNNTDDTFSDVTSLSPGIGDDSGACMGFTVGDIDLDGDWDLYMSDLTNSGDSPPFGNPLYLGNGDGTFADNSADTAGVQGLKSWGVNFIDADHDRYEDLFVATMVEKTFLFYGNDHDATFTDLTVSAGFSLAAGIGRGSALADFDGDGDLDIAVNVNFEPLRLYQNNSVHSNHWLQVNLNADYSNADAIGTLVRTTAGGDTMMRQVLGATSGHGYDSLIPHFGLGEATTATTVEINWPSGIVDVLTDVPADQVVTVVECNADLDGGGSVNTPDLLALLSAWATNPGTRPDFNADGVVATGDLLTLLNDWGLCQ